MPHAELTLTIPETVWIGEFSRSHPDATFRILAAIADGESGVGLVEITSEDLQTLVGDLELVSEIVDLDVLQRRDDTALIRFETEEPVLLLPVQGSGVPLEMPFTITRGKAQWEITAPRDRLAALADQLEAFDISFTVERIGQRIEPEQVLTERQRRLIRAAVEHGYYDTPRACSLTELSDVVGLAKSTCSETLHRAEGRIIKRFVEEMGEELPEGD